MDTKLYSLAQIRAIETQYPGGAPPAVYSNYVALVSQYNTLVSRDTDEQEFAHHRQLFLTEQGYAYRIADESEWSR